METPEQYTKTPEDMIRKHLAMMPEDNWYYQEPVKQAILDYSSELIKENERLREENKLYREALTQAKIMMERDKVGGYRINYRGNPAHEEGCTYLKVCEALSKFQPKKDEPDPRDSGLDDSWIHDVEMGAR